MFGLGGYSVAAVDDLQVLIGLQEFFLSTSVRSGFTSCLRKEMFTDLRLWAPLQLPSLTRASDPMLVKSKKKFSGRKIEIVNSLRRTSFRCSNSLVSFEQRHRRTRLNCKTSESSTSHLEAQAVLLECKLAWGKTLDNRKNNGTTCLKKKGSKFKRKRGRTPYLYPFSRQHSQTLLS